jgi:hypothetical protein
MASWRNLAAHHCGKDSASGFLRRPQQFARSRDEGDEKTSQIRGAVFHEAWYVTFH